MTTDNDSSWIRISSLGTGSFGLVELWRNEKTQETIAIKKSKVNIGQLSDKHRQRWIQEVEIMNRLSHCNIVGTRVLPVELENSGNGLPILCMEYCKKGDLRTVLNNYENFCGVNKNDVLRIMYDVSSAVEYLHKFKLTHRDLKPENIVIQQIKNRTVYKLIDLGYAKELGDSSISASIVGTLNYLAPELLWKERYSCSVDYWSLGILFYEIITGTRPFLPTMQLTKTWMDHIKGKKYEDISAREIDGRVEFYTKIEDLSHVPECLRDDLVPWFRVALQWDPKKRGKIKNQSDELVIFKMLKNIFEKQIIQIFIVSLYKFQSYTINSTIKLSEIKQLVHEREGIDLNQQIFTDSSGKILQDNDIYFAKLLPVKNFIVFDKENLCLNDFPSSKIPKIIQEMLIRSRINCHYQILKSYYGGSLFFINQELELYRSYILALGILIDLCDTQLKSLSVNIESLMAGTQLLVSRVEVLSTKFENSNVNKNKKTFNDLKEKINIFFQRTTRLKDEFKGLSKKNEELKGFSDVNWMSEISQPHDRAVDFLKRWNGDRNQRNNPSAMVKIVFDFLAARDKQLHSKELEKIAQNIVHFQKKLLQLEEVLKSVTALLNLYRDDVEKISEINSKNILELSSNTEATPQSVLRPDDSIIFDSIVIRNMIGGLLTEMDVWKRKLAGLSLSDD